MRDVPGLGQQRSPCRAPCFDKIAGGCLSLTRCAYVQACSDVRRTECVSNLWSYRAQALQPVKHGNAAVNCSLTQRSQQHPHPCFKAPCPAWRRTSCSCW